jgi:hypothetical protein
MSNKPFDFSDFEMGSGAGLDALFAREPQIAAPFKTARRKVASLGDISDFVRLSSDQLIHKSKRDLWTLKKEADGSFFIERLFDDNGSPLKG